MTLQEAQSALKTLDDWFATPTTPQKNTVVVGVATMFALNWNGSVDRSDNGVGAWGAKTANKTIMGCSLPETVLIGTAGLSGTWNQCKAAVGKWLAEDQVQARVTLDGVSALCDVVDTGPARWTHNFIDLTYAAAHMLDTQGYATVAVEILSKGIPVEIKGWDIKNGCEIQMTGTV